MSDTAAPILVASDLSPRSDRAMQRAFRIGAAHNRKVIAFSVLDDAMPADIVKETHARAQARLARFAASLAKDNPYEVRTTIGDPTADVLTMIDKTGTDLLVIGSHRPRAFLGALRETTMQRIVRHTNCPVLLAQDTCDHDYDTVLLACDFSPACAAALGLARRLAPQAKIAPIHALHLPYSGFLGRSDQSKTELEAPFRTEAEAANVTWRVSQDLDADPQVSETEILIGSPYPVMRREAEHRPADLIAFGAHGRAGSARAILGSLASDLTSDPPCDLLIARPQPA